LRQFLIGEYQVKSAKVKPSEVEAELKRILKDRQLRRNLKILEETGAEISYNALDVRDADAFGQLIDDVYGRWGRIDGVIHGAGIIDDKLIRDKSVESFEAVYRTKVVPALTLARKLHPGSLKFLVFFSSVAGRFGNVGQCDYSAANEVLNKLADRLSVEWPNVYTVSINWGPWAAGMVSEELIRLYALRDIQPIPMEIGAQYCVDVLRRHAKEEPELVITASLAQIAPAGFSVRL
jgi:NAD(P)-dependent dehydrogenase (short-subunit alcohol dehydrogenase family)